MPGVRRRQHHAHTGTSAYHVGERQYFADGHRAGMQTGSSTSTVRNGQGGAATVARGILLLHGTNKCKRGSTKPGAGGAPEPRKGGTLHVVTTHMRRGYLRKNGVPYSGDAVLTEYYNRFDLDGNSYLVVQSVVDDPEYLKETFVTSGQFRLEPDGSKWNPSPCRPLWPRSTNIEPAWLVLHP